MSGRRFTLCALGAAIAMSCIHADPGFIDTNRIIQERTAFDPNLRREPDGDDGSMAIEARPILQHPLTPEGALRVAILNNREVRAEYETLGIAAAAVVGASLLPNPSGNIAYRFPVGAGSATRAAFWDVDATIDITSILLIPARHGAAQATFDAQKLVVASRTLAIGYDAMERFYDYQASLQRADIQQVALQAAEAAAQAARLLRQAGNIPALDADQYEATFQDARIQLAAAQNNATQLRERLQASLGLSGNAFSLTVEARLPEVPPQEVALDSLESGAVERSLALRALEQRIAAGRVRAVLTRAEGLIPRMEVGVAAAQEQGEIFVGPAMRVSVPVLNQGQGEVAARVAEVRRDEADLIATAVRLRAIARSVRAQIGFARDRATWYRHVQLPLRQHIVEQSQLQFNAMQIGVFQLLQARRDQLRAGAEYVSALHDYWLAHARAARLAAGGDPEPVGLSEASGGMQP